jgi:hypothetical protein
MLHKDLILSVIALLALAALWSVAVFVIKPTLQYPQQVSVFEQSQKGSEKEEISKWKTYRNTEFGFEFRYPGNWRIISSKDEYLEIGNSLFGIYLDDQGTMENQPQILFLVKTTKNHLFLPPGESSRKWGKYTLGGQDAYISTTFSGIDFLLPLKNKEQWLLISTHQSALNKITEEILSTVRVIEPTTGLPKTSK